MGGTDAGAPATPVMCHVRPACQLKTTPVPSATMGLIYRMEFVFH